MSKKRYKFTAIKAIVILMVALVAYKYRSDISTFLWEHQSPRLVDVLKE